MFATKELRGDIIERSANLETLMGCVVSMVYFGRVELSFTFDLWADEYCSFALKRRLLMKLAPRLSEIKQFEQSLNRLGTIRNYFAHVGMQTSNRPEPNAATRIPDPRDYGRSVDFEALHKEFLEKEEPVLDALFEEYKRLGGDSKP